MNRALCALEKSPIHERQGPVGSPGLPDPLSHNAPLCPPAATSQAPALRGAALEAKQFPQRGNFLIGLLQRVAFTALR